MNIKRREFLKYALTAAASMTVGGGSGVYGAENGIPYRSLGTTGEEVSLLCLGGYHIGVESLSEKESIRLMRTAIEEGVNFFDNAWHYHPDGRSERRMGKALQDGYRDGVFLMTKHHGRTPEKAKKHLQDSLERLQVDTIDLWQFHEVLQQDSVDRIYSSGVLDYVQELRDEGTIRYIGFTGHRRPHIHREMIERGFEWDTVQFPVNPLDYHHYSFSREIIPLANKHDIGIIAMKTLASGNLPQRNIMSAQECHRFAMSHPVSTVCTGMESMDELEQNLDTFKNMNPMDERDMDHLIASVEAEGQSGKHEWWK